MTDMRIRGRSLGILAIAVVLVACVPDPANRTSPSPIDSLAVAAPTPVPTPAGPTPTPSYVRPTPTPLPTFFVYKVAAGDGLERIAKRFGTTGRSIAYWNRLTYPSLDPDSGAYKPDHLVVGWMLKLIPNTQVDPENLPPGSETPALETPAPSLDTPTDSPSVD